MDVAIGAVIVKSLSTKAEGYIQRNEANGSDRTGLEEISNAGPGLPVRSTLLIRALWDVYVSSACVHGPNMVAGPSSVDLPPRRLPPGEAW